MKSKANYLGLLFAGLLCAFPAMAAKEYVGTVTPTATSTYAMFTCAAVIYGNYGYIARPGEIATPEVKNSNGDILKQGDKLLQFDMRYWKAQLDLCRAQMKQYKALTEVDLIDSIRYKDLSNMNANSVQDYQGMEIQYYTDMASYGNFVGQYDMYFAQVAAYTDIAPCELIVTAVNTSLGPIPGPGAAMSISQLNPIGVSIKMSREEAKSIGNNTPVQIIPLNSDKPQGIIYGNSVLTDDGIEFVTENYPVIEGTTLITDPTIPVLRRWGFVKKFYIDKKPEVISVPSSALNEEAGKYFVWRAKGQKTMQPDKAIERTFNIEKVYVTPENLYRQTENFERIVALKDPGRLEMYDLVLSIPPEGLIDGQKVIYPEDAYLLMPGDQVKVIVGR